MATVSVDARYPPPPASIAHHPPSPPTPLHQVSHDRRSSPTPHPSLGGPPSPPGLAPDPASSSARTAPSPTPATASFGWSAHSTNSDLQLAQPHSAPAYTSTFPINNTSNSIDQASPVPHVKVEPGFHSPSGWSEPRQFARDSFQNPSAAHTHSQQPQYRHSDDWHNYHAQAQTHPQAQQDHIQNHYSSYPQHTPQYTFWRAPPYPGNNMPQPNQSEEKRRQAELHKARRHVCPVCDKRFNRPSSLNTHMSVHTGAKPYQCLREGCGRRFSVSSNLRRHERTHDARARPKAAAPAHPGPTQTFSAGYYPGTNYYMQPQFDYAMPSSGLRDYAIIGGGMANSNTGAGNMMGMGQRRESAPAYYQTTPAPSPTPAQMFQHKSMST